MIPVELVHSTPVDEWHRDLAELVRVLSGLMADDAARFKAACTTKTRAA